MYKTPSNKRPQQIFITAIPFMLLMVSQSINSLIDMFIVSRISLDAVAAVGLCGFVFSVLTSSVIGIMLSVQTIVANNLGAGNVERAVNALHSALFLALSVGLLIMALALVMLNFIPDIIHDNVLAENCRTYLQILVIATPAIGMIRAFRGYFGAIGANNLSVAIILSIYGLNFTIGYSLVNLGYGIGGAAIGTCIASYSGVLLFLLSNHFIAAEYRFYRAVARQQQRITIIKLSYYAGLQQMFFSGGFAMMFFIASQISPAALAMITVLNNLMLLSITPLIGIGMATALFISKALGAKQHRKAQKWGNAALKVGLVIFIIQLSWLINPHWIMGLFIQDPLLIEQYIGILRLTLFFVFFEVFAQILKFAMFGAGFNRQIARVTITLQWLVFIPVIYFLCVVHQNGIETLWLCFLIYRACESALLIMMWHKGQWLPNIAVSVTDSKPFSPSTD